MTVAWINRRIMPHHPKFNSSEPTIVIQTERFSSRLNLEVEPIWQNASISKSGRRAILRPAGDVITLPAFLWGWRVRRPGGDVAALVLRLGDHLMRGRLVSVSPQHVALEYTDRMLVVTPEVVVAVRGAYEDRAFGYVGDILERTYAMPPVRRRDLPEGDLEILSALAPA